MTKPIAHVHVLHLLKAGCSVNFFMPDLDLKPSKDLVQEPNLIAQVTFPGHEPVLLEALSLSTLWVHPEAPDWRRALHALADLCIPHSVNHAILNQVTN